ncbi:MAG: TIGR02266 family protein [Nitrospirae bacterium]|nr:TIGR02266 family protein [Nitrospirota bacterium]
MSDDFETFARQVGTGSTDKAYARKMPQCPQCKEFLSETYLEQNPFPEVPCSSCGSLITVRSRRDDDLTTMDKRTEKRCPVSLRVSYMTFNEFIDEYTKNVSRRGMFIKTKRHHELGEVAELQLHVPELPHPVRIKGEIVHVELNAPREEDCGVGVKFIDIDDQSREALISFIKARENCE